MKRPLKVFGGSTTGRDEVMVAATSMEKARLAVNAALNTFIPISFMREYWSVMGNNDSVKLATNNPGCVFQRPNDYKSPWTLVQPKD